MENLIMKAFYENIQNILVKKEKSEKDTEYIVTLLQEIKERINNLTRRRSDLHKEFDLKLDNKIIGNMISNNALEENDIKLLINFVYTERLLKLCPPFMDSNVLETQNELLSNLNENTINETIVEFINSTHDILNDIYISLELFHKTHQKE